MENHPRIGIPVSSNNGHSNVNSNNSGGCGSERQKTNTEHLLHGGFLHRPQLYSLSSSTNTNRNSLISPNQDQPQCLLHSQEDAPGFLLTSSPLSMSTCCALSSATSHSGHWPKWPRSRIKDLDEEYSPSGISLSSSSTSSSNSSSLSFGSSSGSLGRKCHQSRGGGVLSSFLRKASLRFFQIACVLMCALCIYTLVDNIVYLAKTHSKENGNRITTSRPEFRDHLQSWIIERDSRPSSSSYHSQSLIANTNRLLDIQDFRLLLNNVTMCRRENANSSPELDESTGTGIYFMILVHSDPSHFEERQAIRSTWGSIKSLKNLGIRLVFLLGSALENELIQSPIQRESLTFGDIVSGNFADSYRNLTYKHLMGYKWALTYCPGATFILKTDDDAFIDIFQLFDFTTRTYGYKPLDTLVCNVFPEGTKPVRVSSAASQEVSTVSSSSSYDHTYDHDHFKDFQLRLHKRNTTTKWTVTQDEYPYATYPKYCGGLAYFSTPDLLRKILLTSENTKLFWIDDVFVTGILRELVGVEPFYLNLRYSYEPEEYRKWLDDRQPHHRFRKIPFMIVHIERGPKFSKEMNDLWRKTLQVWSP